MAVSPQCVSFPMFKLPKAVNKKAEARYPERKVTKSYNTGA